LIIEAGPHRWNQRGKRLVIFALALFDLKTLVMGNFTTLILHTSHTIRWVVRIDFQKGRLTNVRAKIFIRVFRLLWLDEDESRAVDLKPVNLTVLWPIEISCVCGHLSQDDGVTFMVNIFSLIPPYRLVGLISCNPSYSGMFE
jgi:hypothetical protein